MVSGEQQIATLVPPAGATKPRLLAAIYHNADYYPPTVNAINQLSTEFQVTLICRNIDEPFRCWPDGIEVERVGAPGNIEGKVTQTPIAKLMEYGAFRSSIRRVLERDRPRVAYAWEPHAFAAVIAAGATRLHIPIVYHLHEMPEVASTSFASLQGWITRYARRHTGDASAIVFPEKNRAEQYLKETEDSRPALIVPNCPARNFAPRLPPWSDLIGRRLRSSELLYMGTLGESNGSLEAVCALALLGPSTRLTMIGRASSDLCNEILRMAEANAVTARVSLPGWMPHSALPARAMAASVGLSLHKPVSRNLEFASSATNKIFEYAACGLPVVMPDRASYREMFANERWAMFADPNDPRSIAAVITELFADPNQYAARCQAARRAFEERYNYERTFAAVFSAVRNLAADEGGVFAQ